MMQVRQIRVLRTVSKFLLARQRSGFLDLKTLCEQNEWQ